MNARANGRRGVSLIVLILAALGLSLLPAFTMPANALDAPPSPTVIDRSGSDQDQFVIPMMSNVQYVSPDEAVYYVPGNTYSTNGASEVPVLARAFNASGERVEKLYPLTFLTSVTGAEATNLYIVEVGSCDPLQGQVALTAFVQNVDDLTDRFLQRVSVSAYNLDLSGSTKSTDMVMDGERRAIPFASSSGIGMSPGTNTINFYHGEPGASAPVFTQKVWVPVCGSTVIPEGDPGDPSEPSGPVVTTPVVSKAPTASIRFSGRRAYVRTGTIGVLPKSGKTSFKITSNPRYGATRSYYATRNNGTSGPTKTLYRLKRGTVVTVYARNAAGKWIKLVARRK